MDEMKPMLSVGETVEEYFHKAMLAQLNSPSALAAFPPNLNIRNADYYAKREPEPLNPETHCIHCGHSLEDYDF